MGYSFLGELVPHNRGRPRRSVIQKPGQRRIGFPCGDSNIRQCHSGRDSDARIAIMIGATTAMRFLEGFIWMFLIAAVRRGLGAHYPATPSAPRSIRTEPEPQLRIPLHFNQKDVKAFRIVFAVQEKT
jgi:hypothetical protein